MSSAALHTSGIYVPEFKTLLENVSFSGKNCQTQAFVGAKLK
jgi:hypothetical protein